MRGRWAHETPYELPQVVELTQEIQRNQETARKRVQELNQTIEGERQRSGFLHDLLRETGDALVAAVRKALEALEFKLITDSDQTLKGSERKREDLQVHDMSPVLLVEIKGISGLPKEDDAIQVAKYIAPRMKEWGRTDVRGLSIINHQRHLPGLERSPNPFGPDVITHAVSQEFGLLTTWDLFRLLRGYLKLKWRSADVADLFYKNGRIEPIPAHYHQIGAVEHFWERPSAVGIRLTLGDLHVGDRIAYELPVEFEEQDVDSLQVENECVPKAEISSLAGVQTKFAKQVLQKGVRVFRIQ